MLTTEWLDKLGRWMPVNPFAPTKQTHFKFQAKKCSCWQHHTEWFFCSDKGSIITEHSQESGLAQTHRKHRHAAAETTASTCCRNGVTSSTWPLWNLQRKLWLCPLSCPVQCSHDWRMIITEHDCLLIAKIRECKVSSLDIPYYPHQRRSERKFTTKGKEANPYREPNTPQKGVMLLPKQHMLQLPLGQIRQTATACCGMVLTT